MVTGFWKREFCLKHFRIHHSKPNVFIRCQWQNGETVPIPYLIYRFLVAAIFLSTLVISFLDAGRPVNSSVWKWFIYLTNWGFTVCTLQSIFAAAILFVKWKDQSNQEFPCGAIKLPLTYKVYWVLHTLAVTIAFGITIAYWGTIYDPATNKLDFINLVTHGGNSLLMLLDLAIVSHPTRLIHAFIPLTFTVSYLIFSCIYYYAGGTDKLNRPFIYPLLNWETPVRTIVVCLIGLVFVTAVHAFAWVLTLCRRKLAPSQKREKQIELDIPPAIALGHLAC